MARKKRRSVEHDAPNRFVGWERIEALHDRAKWLDFERGKDYHDHSLYFVALFETGGREYEVVQLKPEQIHWNEEAIVVERMEVLKRRRRFTRKVIIKREENPLAEIFINFVENCESDYLLPGRQPFTGVIIPDRHISVSTVYDRITAIDPDIWPHWIRDQRSWHLSKVRDLDSFDLRKWFEWGSMDMPAKYAGRRSEEDLARALGIKRLP